MEFIFFVFFVVRVIVNNRNLNVIVFYKIFNISNSLNIIRGF